MQNTINIKLTPLKSTSLHARQIVHIHRSSSPLPIILSASKLHHFCKCSLPLFGLFDYMFSCIYACIHNRFWDWLQEPPFLGNFSFVNLKLGFGFFLRSEVHRKTVPLAMESSETIENSIYYEFLKTVCILEICSQTDL